MLMCAVRPESDGFRGIKLPQKNIANNKTEKAWLLPIISYICAMMPSGAHWLLLLIRDNVVF